MPAPQILRSRRARWAVPVGLVAVLAIGVGVATTTAGAAPALPARSAADLLAAVSQAAKQPFSGTVVETARLGLPALPDAGSGTSLSLQSLVTGSHTARVWYGSIDKVRVSLIGNLAESDVIRNGRDVWVWSSSGNTADHSVLPAGEAGTGSASPLPLDPRTAAAQALAAIDPTTAVTVDGTSQVAGRPAYELVLSPRASGSLVSQVRLALDQQTSVPLRVQVIAKGGTEPAFETGFTAVQFDRPADSVFAFTPPPGAKVSQNAAPDPGTVTDKAAGTVAGNAGQAGSSGGPQVAGSGWLSVVRIDGWNGAVDQPHSRSSATALQTVLQATTPVTGAFGSGQLLRTPLLSVLLLDDGRAFVGAVEPALLEQAAAHAAGTR
jgi:outer membrane lipoprotein-sorting protein